MGSAGSRRASSRRAASCGMKVAAQGGGVEIQFGAVERGEAVLVCARLFDDPVRCAAVALGHGCSRARAHRPARNLDRLPPPAQNPAEAAAGSGDSRAATKSRSAWAFSRAGRTCSRPTGGPARRRPERCRRRRVRWPKPPAPSCAWADLPRWHWRGGFRSPRRSRRTRFRWRRRRTRRYARWRFRERRGAVPAKHRSECSGAPRNRVAVGGALQFAARISAKPRPIQSREGSEDRFSKRSTATCGTVCGLSRRAQPPRHARHARKITTVMEPGEGGSLTVAARGARYRTRGSSVSNSLNSGKSRRVANSGSCISFLRSVKPSSRALRMYCSARSFCPCLA